MKITILLFGHLNFVSVTDIIFHEKNSMLLSLQEHLKCRWERDPTSLLRKQEKSLPVEEKTITPISASQSMASSSAFLNRPLLRFEKVTCLVVVFSIFLILIFSLTIPSFSVLRLLLPHHMAC
ncbi:unnamed protein product [Spirodela intermedia]|uniref:Uncharacterized protein n=1 Tax=Spirodela intermedia TaxID=51605 RepID=A0A7I8J2H8_SPIIN|nr:unnamed protein product [Spirodela intermedia]CAA6664358.1 unnamed protein product [Spirodela intermedia]